VRVGGRPSTDGSIWRGKIDVNAPIDDSGIMDISLSRTPDGAIRFDLLPHIGLDVELACREAAVRAVRRPYGAISQRLPCVPILVFSNIQRYFSRATVAIWSATDQQRAIRTACRAWYADRASGSRPRSARRAGAGHCHGSARLDRQNPDQHEKYAMGQETGQNGARA
jgi:hypothetical protein